jgi:hypothetical protein
MTVSQEGDDGVGLTTLHPAADVERIVAASRGAPIRSRLTPSRRVDMIERSLIGV